MFHTSRAESVLIRLNDEGSVSYFPAVVDLTIPPRQPTTTSAPLALASSTALSSTASPMPSQPVVSSATGALPSYAPINATRPLTSSPSLLTHSRLTPTASPASSAELPRHFRVRFVIPSAPTVTPLHRSTLIADSARRRGRPSSTVHLAGHSEEKVDEKRSRVSSLGIACDRYAAFLVDRGMKGTEASLERGSDKEWQLMAAA